MSYSTDFSSTSSQVQQLIETDDPATQQQDMEAVAGLYAQLPVEEIEELTRTRLNELAPNDAADLFPALARRLDERQLAAVVLGLGDQNEQAANLVNAVKQFSSYDVRERFFAQSQAPWRDPSQDPAAPGVASQPAARNPQREYRLFMQNPAAVAQPLINAHYRQYGSSPIQVTGGTHLNNEIARALGWKTTLSQPPATVDQARALLQGQDLFQPDASQWAQRAGIAEQIGRIGGDSPRVTVVPVVYALPGEKGGVGQTPLFKVEGGDGKTHYVDDQGLAYRSIADWQRNNGLPVDGVVAVLPRRAELNADGNGDVPLYVTDARKEGFFESAALQKGSIGTTLVGTGALLTGTGLGTVPGLVVGAAGLYLTGGAAERLVSRGTHGGDVSPLNRDTWWDYGALGLAAAGLGSTGASLAGLQSARTLAQATSAGGLVMAGASGGQLAVNWDSLSGDQKLAQTGMVALGALGAAAGYRAASRMPVGQAERSLPPIPLTSEPEAATPLPSTSPRTAPPGAAELPPGGNFGLPGSALKFDPFNPREPRVSSSIAYVKNENAPEPSGTLPESPKPPLAPSRWDGKGTPDSNGLTASAEVLYPRPPGLPDSWDVMSHRLPLPHELNPFLNLSGSTTLHEGMNAAARRMTLAAGGVVPEHTVSNFKFTGPGILRPALTTYAGPVEPLPDGSFRVPVRSYGIRGLFNQNPSEAELAGYAAAVRSATEQASQRAQVSIPNGVQPGYSEPLDQNFLYIRQLTEATYNFKLPQGASLRDASARLPVPADLPPGYVLTGASDPQTMHFTPNGALTYKGLTEGMDYAASYVARRFGPRMVTSEVRDLELVSRLTWSGEQAPTLLFYSRPEVNWVPGKEPMRLSVPTRAYAVTLGQEPTLLATGVFDWASTSPVTFKPMPLMNVVRPEGR